MQKDTVSSDEKWPLVEMTENGFGCKTETPKIYTKPFGQFTFTLNWREFSIFPSGKDQVMYLSKCN